MSGINDNSQTEQRQNADADQTRPHHPEYSGKCIQILDWEALGRGKHETACRVSLMRRDEDFSGPLLFVY